MEVFELTHRKKTLTVRTVLRTCGVRNPRLAKSQTLAPVIVGLHMTRYTYRQKLYRKQVTGELHRVHLEYVG